MVLAAFITWTVVVFASRSKRQEIFNISFRISVLLGKQAAEHNLALFQYPIIYVLEFKKVKKYVRTPKM